MFNWHQVDLSHTKEMQSNLLAESKFDLPYLILIGSSCAIATFGLLSNSTAVIIGAMIVAPLMMPIRGLAFGALIGNAQLFRTGVISVAGGTLIAVACSWIIGTLTGITTFGSEILSRTQPNLLDLGIAVAAGGIAGYAKIEQKVSGTVAGTAIAVALMPPICVIGLGLAQSSRAIAQGATLLFLTNLLGIALACMLVFLIAGYAPLDKARKALISAVALTSILLIPLGISFANLVARAQLETSLRKALLNKTITFQRLELSSLKVNWVDNPPQVRLLVYAKEPVTQKQVELLEAFLARELKRPFKLIFAVTYFEEVQREKSER